MGNLVVVQIEFIGQRLPVGIVEVSGNVKVEDLANSAADNIGKRLYNDRSLVRLDGVGEIYRTGSTKSICCGKRSGISAGLCIKGIDNKPESTLLFKDGLCTAGIGSGNGAFVAVFVSNSQCNLNSLPRLE